MSKIEDIAKARRKREKKEKDEEYKEALARIIERAKKTDW